jgi:hypothetical protein
MHRAWFSLWLISAGYEAFCMPLSVMGAFHYTLSCTARLSCVMHTFPCKEGEIVPHRTWWSNVRFLNAVEAIPLSISIREKVATCRVWTHPWISRAPGFFFHPHQPADWFWCFFLASFVCSLSGLGSSNFIFFQFCKVAQVVIIISITSGCPWRSDTIRQCLPFFFSFTPNPSLLVGARDGRTQSVRACEPGA